MNKLCLVIIATSFLSGCATDMAYLNTQKPAEELKKDKAYCQSIVDASDFKDTDLQQRKFNDCMKDKGYNVVSQDQAEKIQGFKELWIKPGADFKAYEAIFIDKVDLSQVKIDNLHIPDTKVTDEDITNLGDEMLNRFSKALSIIMPIITDRGEATGKKVLYMNLRLTKIAQTNVGANTALQIAGHFSPIPLPDAPEGTFSFKAEITDYSDKEKLITISDEVKASKNSSLAGMEKFEKWKQAYNVIDYWADHLAALLAKQRNQEYKSSLRIKLIGL